MESVSHRSSKFAIATQSLTGEGKDGGATPSISTPTFVQAGDPLHIKPGAWFTVF
jgi:hypothetical protein